LSELGGLASGLGWACAVAAWVVSARDQEDDKKHRNGHRNDDEDLDPPRRAGRRRAFRLTASLIGALGVVRWFSHKALLRSLAR
jgi:hypothetical protein